VAHEKGFRSIAFPLIGAGSGGFTQDRAKAIMEDEFGQINVPMEAKIVLHQSRHDRIGQDAIVSEGS
jgi:O-acetyl-ADP-ribose deacetylase (regulator of RNase III)